jgi:hypothetical protein
MLNKSVGLRHYSACRRSATRQRTEVGQNHKQALKEGTPIFGAFNNAKIQF